MTWSPPTMGNISLPCFLRAKFNRIKKFCQGLPWWSSGWESTCQGRGHGFDPWSEKIPCAKGQLSPCHTDTETTCKSLCPTRQATVTRGPHAATRECPIATVKIHNSQKYVDMCVSSVQSLGCVRLFASP